MASPIHPSRGVMEPGLFLSAPLVQPSTEGQDIFDGGILAGTTCAVDAHGDVGTIDGARHKRGSPEASTETSTDVLPLDDDFLREVRIQEKMSLLIGACYRNGRHI